MTRIFKQAPVILLLLANCAPAEEDRDRLVGAWRLTNSAGDVAECANFLEFHPDGRYFVFNDCYGDSDYPLTQSGRWALDADGDLYLGDRVTRVAYAPWEEDAELVLQLEMPLERQLLLNFTPEFSEHYERVDQRLIGR